MASVTVPRSDAGVKVCPQCSEAKPLADFAARSNGNVATWCRPCNKAYQRAWYLRNQEKVKARAREWSRDNPERKSATDKAWREKNVERCRANAKRWAERNPDKRHAIHRRWYLANKEKADAASKRWVEEHPAHVVERSRRIKLVRKQAYVSWADREKMALFYEEAARLTHETGIPHEVDHIIPLTSNVVCGLHCEANLRVVTRAVNRSKSNKLLEAA